MSTITVELSPEVYARLARHAKEKGKAPDEYSRELLEKALSPVTYPQRSAKEVLKEAGMVVELGDELLQYISDDVPSLDEVVEIFSTTTGPSLTEILEQQRGPKP
jgi:predicted DNA-binding protein